MAPKALDISGQRFGILTIIERAPKIKGSAQSRWKYRCDCGIEGVATLGNLRSGQSKSCGCQRRIAVLAANIKHGHTRDGQISPTWKSWHAMRARCENSDHHKYCLYGALGISVCERWSLFENFLADMGERPAGTTIDRIDTYGNYEPGNCRWATVTQQNNNRKNNHLVKYQGIKMPLGDAVRLSGSSLKIGIVWKRLDRGWPLEKALRCPPLS